MTAQRFSFEKSVWTLPFRFETLERSTDTDRPPDWGGLTGRVTSQGRRTLPAISAVVKVHLPRWPGVGVGCLAPHMTSSTATPQAAPRLAETGRQT